METIDGDTGGKLEGCSSECRQIEELETSTQETETLEKRDAGSEGVEGTNKEMDVAEKVGEVNLTMEKHEHEEKHVPEDRDGMEDREERDWVEEYTERRRRFLCDDGKETKLKIFTKLFEETMDDDDPPPSPPPPPRLPVCGKEKDSETQNLEETESFEEEEAKNDKPANKFIIQNPNLSRCDPQRDPTSDTAHPQDPYWDVNVSSNLHSSNSDTPFTSSSQPNPHDHQPNSAPCTLLPHVPKSNLDPSVELPSNSPSLFALAVSQRVQRLGNGVRPLSPSARRTSSPTRALQSLGSHHGSSQKLYFQNLIKQELTSKIPAPQGVCSEAPPVSAAPPTGTTTKARRRAWSSFSRMR